MSLSAQSARQSRRGEPAEKVRHSLQTEWEWGGGLYAVSLQPRKDTLDDALEEKKKICAAIIRCRASFRKSNFIDFTMHCFFFFFYIIHRLASD